MPNSDIYIDATVGGELNSYALRFSLRLQGVYPSIAINVTPITFGIALYGGMVVSTPHGSSPIVFSLLFGLAEVRTSYLGKNTVRWSSIGDLNFIPGEQNVAGFATLPWRGPAYGIEKIGNTLVLLGAGGISLYTPIEEPVVGWGEYTFPDAEGVKSNDLYATDGNIILFINAQSELCRLDVNAKSSVDGALTVIGYAEYLSPLQSPIMYYIKRLRRFIISDATISYFFDKTSGLYSTTLAPSGIIVTSSKRYAIYASGSNKTITAFTAVLHDTDFESLGIKTLQSVAVELTDIGKSSLLPLLLRMRVVVDWRMSSAEVYKRQLFKVNPEGIATFAVSAKEFRIGIIWEDPDNSIEDALSYLTGFTVTWQNSDIRYRKGRQNESQS